MSSEAPTFLPEYDCLKASDGYRALYRLFSNTDWRQVRNRATRSPAIYPTAIEAIKAAKQEVLLKLNPQIMCADVDTAHVGIKEDPDSLAVKDWEERKRDETAAAHYMKRRSTMRPVVVEHKVRRAKP